MRWIAALLLTVALSGCLGGEETTDPLDAEAPDPTPLGPPSGNLTALLDAALPTNASAPVVFTLDATGATDPTNASWSLAEQGDGLTLLDAGTGIPATVEHTFAAGPHTVRLEVLDAGLDANATLSFVIDAVEDAGEAVNTTGNATGNATEAGAVAYHFSDTMPANADLTADAPVQTHTFQVADGVQALTVWVEWGLDVPGILGMDTPQDVNLDVVLTDPDGAVVYEGDTSDFEYGHIETNATGTWTLEVVGNTVPREQTYTVDVLAWNAAPQVQTFTGSFVADAAVGWPGPDFAGDGAAEHPVTIPAATTVAARLTWNIPEGQAASSGDCLRWDRTQDVDFDAYLGDEMRFSSGNFLGCEFGFTSGADELGGAWAFKVKPYQVVDTAYTLVVFSA